MVRTTVIAIFLTFAAIVLALEACTMAPPQSASGQPGGADQCPRSDGTACK